MVVYMYYLFVLTCIASYGDAYLVDQVALVQVNLHGQSKDLSYDAPPQDCYTAVAGEQCYKEVRYVIDHGLKDHPQWYPGLTKNSSFEEFQLVLHSMARLADVCAKPCGVSASRASTLLSKQKAEEPECRTAVEGDRCYSEVKWVMTRGLKDHPQWYPGLTNSSSFEEFQLVLHGRARLAGVCTMPCGVPASRASTLLSKQKAEEPECRTAVKGDRCYDEVKWVMTRGLKDHPQWYPGLTSNSTLEEFQMVLHGKPRLAHVCGKPCQPGARVAEHVAVPSEASLEATPAPTLEPGKYCACNTCSWYDGVDLDRDGCIQSAEAETAPFLDGKFKIYDKDGDGCISRSECEAYTGEPVPSSADIEVYIPTPECDEGYYFTRGETTCLACNGDTRRRRANSCTQCPNNMSVITDGDHFMEADYKCRPGPYVVPDPNTTVDPNKTTSRLCVNIMDRVCGGVLQGRPLTLRDKIVISNRVQGKGAAWQSATIVGVHPKKPGVECMEIFPKLAIKVNPYDVVQPACSNTKGSPGLAGDYADENGCDCRCGMETCSGAMSCEMTCEGKYSTGAMDAIPGSEHQTGDTGCCHGPLHPSLPTPVPTVSAKGDPHLVNLQGEHFDINHAGEFTLLRLPQDTRKPAEISLEATIAPEHGKPCTTYITEVEITGTVLDNRIVQVRSYLKSRAKNGTDTFLGIRVLENRQDKAPWVNMTEWHEGDTVLPSGTSNYQVTLSKQAWSSKKQDEQKKVPSVAGQFVFLVKSTKATEGARITVRQDVPRQEHLNLAVIKLSALGRADIGGLLGFDSHPEDLEVVTNECQRHRDGLDGKGPKNGPKWKTRWEAIKKEHERGDAPGEAMRDNEAGASLVGARNMMCVCTSESDDGDEETTPVDGVVVDFQTARMAEASWD